MNEVLTPSFILYAKVLLSAVLIYVIIYSLLLKIEIFGSDSKGAYALIAFITAVIVSLSGIASYAVAYSASIFIIIILLIFMTLMIVMFLGIKFEQISELVAKKESIIAILAIVGILFFIVLIKSYFAVNNTFDTTNPPSDTYDINTSYNIGANDVSPGILKSLDSFLNTDILGAIIFLILIGCFVFMLN